MGFWNNITADLKIDSNYGDYEIVGNDLVINRNTKIILKNVVIERFKTNTNDFILNPNYGASIEDFIGKGIDNRLAEDISTRLRYALTYDDYITNNEIEILPAILDHTIKLFVYIRVENNDEITITATYDGEGIHFD